MRENRSFAEILHEKLETFPSEKVKKSPLPPQKPLTFTSETPFSAPIFSWKQQRKKYVVLKKTRSQSPKKEESKPPPPLPSANINGLNQGEKKALTQFQSMGELIHHNEISEMQLKRSYRILVKKYHPDIASGSAENFLKLQKAYELLFKGVLRIIATCGNEVDEA